MRPLLPIIAVTLNLVACTTPRPTAVPASNKLVRRVDVEVVEPVGDIRSRMEFRSWRDTYVPEDCTVRGVADTPGPSDYRMGSSPRMNYWFGVSVRRHANVPTYEGLVTGAVGEVSAPPQIDNQRRPAHVEIGIDDGGIVIRPETVPDLEHPTVFHGRTQTPPIDFLRAVQHGHSITVYYMMKEGGPIFVLPVRNTLGELDKQALAACLDDINQVSGGKRP